MEPDSKRIIFLDSDGVIQPHTGSNAMRSGHLTDRLLEDLCQRYDPALVREGDPYDLAAAFWDWDPGALGRLKYLCRRTGSRIVLHSDWTKNTRQERLKLFFALHGMQEYILDVCNRTADSVVSAGAEKVNAIRSWLAEHEGGAAEYLVLDDRDFSWEFGRHCVCT